MFAILGSGFGLYGYLPAVAGLNERVLLPTRYRKRIEERDDIRSFSYAIEWRDDDQQVLNDASHVIIAKRPIDQPYWVRECLRRENTTRLLLEKPLAPTPQLSQELLSELESSNKLFRIGYNFRFTDWGKQFINWHRSSSGSTVGSTVIDWQFRAHHFVNNLSTWKRSSSDGGGVIAFFGVHLIALLAELGYSQILSSQIAGKSDSEADKWTLHITGSGMTCRLFLDSNSDHTCFSIHSQAANTNNFSIDQSDVFQANTQVASINGKDIDRRVVILKEICNNLKQTDEKSFSWYSQTIELWRQIEEQTERISEGAWQETRKRSLAII